MSLSLEWGVLIKKVTQSGEISITEKTGCFIRAFDQI